MADITSEQIDELVKQLGKSAGALTSIADKTGSRSAGGGVSKGIIDATSGKSSEDEKKSKETIRNFNRGVSDSFDSLREFSEGTKGLTGAIANISQKFAGGFIFAEMAKYAERNIEVYRELSNYGQTFGGSMLNMSKAAAEAGLPMQEYAKLIKNNSAIVKQLGITGFNRLQKDVRKLSDEYGNYGMSLEQMGEMTLKYADTLRLSGRNAKSLVSIGPEINKFALNMSAISDITGKNREEIEKQALAIMNDALFRAKASDNTLAGMEGYNKALRAAVTELSGQQGEGAELAKALGEASSNIGGVNFTAFGKMVNDLGQSNISQLIEEADARLKRGEDTSQVSSDLVRKVKEQLNDPSVKQSLELQASMGDENAKKMLAMGQELVVYTAAEVRAKEATRKTMQGFEAFMLSFKSTMGDLFGSFISGFLEPFTNSGNQNSIKDFFARLEAIKPQLTELGRTFGELFKSVFNPTTLGTVATLFKIFTQIVTIVLPPVMLALTGLGIVINTIVGSINNAGNFLGDLFGKNSELGKNVADISKVIGLAIFALTGFAAYMKGKEFLSNLFSNSRTAVMNVEAGIVNIKGLGGGGGGGGGDGGGDGGGGEDLFGDGGDKAKKAKKLSRDDKLLKKIMDQRKKRGLAHDADEVAKEFLKRRRSLGGRTSQFLGKNMDRLAGFGGMVLERGRGAANVMTGGALGKITEYGGKLISKASGPIMDGLGKVAQYGSKLAAIPLAGALMSGGLAGFNEFGKSGNLIKSLFVGGGAAGGGLAGQVGGAAAGTLAGPVGTIAGEITGGISGAVAGEKAASWLYDTLFSKMKPKGGPTDQANTEKPKTINEEDLNLTRFFARGGDEKSVKALEKIEEAIKQQTIYVDKGNKADSRQYRTMIEQFSSGAAK